MRTTITIDEDLAKQLRGEMRRSGLSLKEAVNRFLRLGLVGGRKPQRKRFEVRPGRLGLPAGLSYDNVEELLESLEGKTHK